MMGKDFVIQIYIILCLLYLAFRFTTTPESYIVMDVMFFVTTMAIIYFSRMGDNG